MLTRTLPVLLIGLAGIACRTSDAPVDPVWGKQPCSHCKMLVQDPRFAAQVITPQSERAYFDDVGCLVSYLAEHPNAKDARVRDAAGRWVDARAARYRAGASTPMGFGFAVDASGPLDFQGIAPLIAAKNAGGS